VIKFIWTPNQEQFDHVGDCGEGPQGFGYGGCARGLTSVSLYVPNSHEIVHNVTSERGSSHAVFLEGLAVMYGESLGSISNFDTNLDRLFSTTRKDFSFEDYAASGAFVSYLITSYGISTFFEIYEGIGQRTSSVSSEFEELLGEPWSDIGAGFAAYVSCGHNATRRRWQECAAPLISWGKQELVDYQRLDCELDVGSANHHWTTRKFPVPAPGEYLVQVKGDSGTSVRIASCGPCGASSLYEWFSADDNRIVIFDDSQRYYVQYISTNEEASTVGIRVSAR
jgi:hypothetical protein